MKPLVLLVLLAAPPEVRLPPKPEVRLPQAPDELGEAIRAGIKAARPAIERCDGGPCICRALEKVRFDVRLDGGALTISYPMPGGAAPSFTLDPQGRVTDCHF